jgi:hypothetical protein
MAARSGGQEAIERVDEPEGPAEGLLLVEPVSVGGWSEMGAENAVHLEHSGGLTEVNVGAYGVAGAPFVNDNEAEGLNVSETWSIERLVNDVHGLGGESLGSPSGSGLTAIASDEVWRRSEATGG